MKRKKKDFETAAVRSVKAKVSFGMQAWSSSFIPSLFWSFRDFTEKKRERGRNTPKKDAVSCNREAPAFQGFFSELPKKQPAFVFHACLNTWQDFTKLKQNGGVKTVRSEKRKKESKKNPRRTSILWIYSITIERKTGRRTDDNCSCNSIE